jgi:predicted Fe-Mo cluster-binding NifX family protein
MILKKERSMIVAISADQGQGLASPVAHHFGRCRYFVLVHLEDGNERDVSVLENPFWQAHRPGQVPGFLQQRDVGVVISGGMGRKASEMFKAGGIQPLQCEAQTVGEALEAYLRGGLSEPDPCHGGHHHGHGRGHGHGCRDHNGSHDQDEMN